MRDFSEKETSPAYGMLGFSRVTKGGKVPLFGSDIQHGDVIDLVLKEGSVSRGLNRDWYYAGRELVHIEMSQAQFAELITSMNQGSGIPVTIRYFNGKKMPDVPMSSKADVHKAEFRESVDGVISGANDLLKEMQDMLADKKSLGKRDVEAISQKLAMFAAALNQNRDFQLKSFDEYIEKTVVDAKAEIEAFAQNKLAALGQEKLIETLGGGAEDAPKIEPK